MAVKNFKEFTQLESSGGIILFATAVLALIISNSPWDHYYQSFFSLPLGFTLGTLGLSKPLLLWINDGFMTLFFLLVGLEMKREMIEGELNTVKKALSPAIAAIGGMVVPALIYIYLNRNDSMALKGWAIPTATDIAFSLGVLSLVGSRLPRSLKIFLTALAIFDDLGAIFIIAMFYTSQISASLLLLAAILIIILLLLNKLKVTSYGPYAVIGLILWLCVLKSGVHATLAGVVLAFAIPMRDSKDPAFSPLKKLEQALHPWVAFGILPLFAFANAGVSFYSVSFSHFVGPITLGVAAGLFIGKQLGIFGTTLLAIKLKFIPMPKEASISGLYGVSLVAGVGFTMSLFIGTLAFGNLGDTYAAVVRLGVIMGSVLSGLLGYFVLRINNRSR